MEKNFSSAIIEVLMHKDFQKHIKAIQMLNGVSDMFTLFVFTLVTTFIAFFVTTNVASFVKLDTSLFFSNDLSLDSHFFSFSQLD